MHTISVNPPSFMGRRYNGRTIIKIKSCDMYDEDCVKIKVIRLDSPITCPITFEELQTECYELPCGHQFSANIYTWVNEKNNCPLCRKAVNKHKNVVNTVLFSWGAIHDQWVQYVRNYLDRQRLSNTR